jgi:hypothetical protein
MNNTNDPWKKYSELKDVSNIMNDIVVKAKKTREILKSQMNENYVDSLEEDTAVKLSTSIRL